MPTETISLARQFDNAISDEHPDNLKPQKNCLTPSSQKKKKAGVFEKQLLAIATVQNRQNACKFDQQFSENTKQKIISRAQGGAGFTQRNFPNDSSSCF